MSLNWKVGTVNHTTEFTLPCNRHAVAEAISLVEAFCAQHKLAARDRIAVLLVVDELVANTILHGRSAAETQITLRLENRGDRVVIGYADRGIPFNPLRDLPADHAERSVEERLVGGLGWRLIRSYCDCIEYSRSKDENRLTLVRLLRTPLPE